MAIIHIEELIEIIKDHPKYKNEWEQGADAKQALYISFGKKGSDKQVESENHDAADGSMIVVDKSKDNVVQGIEIC